MEVEKIGFALIAAFHAQENGMFRATLNRSTWDSQFNAHFALPRIQGEIN